MFGTYRKGCTVKVAIPLKTGSQKISFFIAVDGNKSQQGTYMDLFTYLSTVTHGYYAKGNYIFFNER